MFEAVDCSTEFLDVRNVSIAKPNLRLFLTKKSKPSNRMIRVLVN